ncbi:MAG: hypothetical protein C0501_30385 [Isosphaera sp.]|nr:hypothetical protein [Isosphaera sp.]
MNDAMLPGEARAYLEGLTGKTVSRTAFFQYLKRGLRVRGGGRVVLASRTVGRSQVRVVTRGEVEAFVSACRAGGALRRRPARAA